MTKFQRELISRATMVVFGLAICYGAYKCFMAAEMIAENPAFPNADRYSRRHSGIGLPLILGCVLGLVGSVLTLLAFLPVWLMEKLFLPAPPRTHENDVPDNIHGPWRL